MPTPETLALVAVTISALSLIVAGFAARYTRAAHVKRIADEQPIIWTDVAHGNLGWTLTVNARNRAAADLEFQSLEITGPAGILIVSESEAYRSDGEGGFTITPEKVARLARKKVEMRLATGKAGSERRGEIIKSPGDTNFERFRIHAEPSFRARNSSSKIKVSMRLTWALKDAESRKRVEHVNITLNAATKPEAAAKRIAT